MKKITGFKKLKNNFFNEYLDKLKLNKHDLVFKLFDDKETFGGARFEEQNYMLSQMTGRLSGLQELGYITKDGEFLKVDEILEKRKRMVNNHSFYLYHKICKIAVNAENTGVLSDIILNFAVFIAFYFQKSYQAFQKYFHMFAT